MNNLNEEKNKVQEKEENEEEFAGDISSIIIAPMEANELKGDQFQDFMEDSINLNK